MAARSTKKTTTSATASTTAQESAEGFSAEERAAMKARAKEVRAARGGRGTNKAAKEAAAVVEAIAGMTGSDREIAEKLHEIVTEVAPDLAPRTWYGMPAYARGGKVVVFFQSAEKFGSRYATLGFNDDAQLDDGSMWPTAYAITKLTAADAKTVRALVRRATGTT